MLSVNINIDPKSEEDLNNALEFIHRLKDPEKKCKELEDQLREELDKSEKKDEEFSSQIKQCEDIYNEKLGQKDEEILRLKKSLESYSVSFGSDDPNDLHFFVVTENKTLEESMISSDSLYCASKSGDIYKFSINYDGPVKAAFANIEQCFEPFCQIQDKIEGANYPNTKTVGKAKLIGSQLQIIEKVVITLIKQ